MKLRGIEFRPVGVAAGTQGFFGEGYWYHSLVKLSGLTFENCGFCAKTTTLEKRTGNLPLGRDGITPRELFPACMVVKPLKGVVLNAVGLSGPGARFLLDDGRWQKREGEPFRVSFMSVGPTPNDRLEELRQFVKLLRQHINGFKAPFALELNFSCANVGLDFNPHVFESECGQALDIADELKKPVIPKLNLLAPVSVVRSIASHPGCDAIVMTNAIHWGLFPDRINWKKLFGTEISPLARFGGGALSGRLLLPLVCEWIREARDSGITKPIWACGGINSTRAVEEASAAGASGVQFASVTMLRPWRTRGIIARGHELFS